MWRWPTTRAADAGLVAQKSRAARRFIRAALKGAFGLNSALAALSAADAEAFGRPAPATPKDTSEKG